MTRLEQLRYDAGLTPEELADQLDGKVSSRTIRRIEAGTRPKPATAVILADHLGVTPTQLLQVVDASASAA